MNQLKRDTVCVIFLVTLFASVYASVTYRVISTGPNGTRAAIDIKGKTLYWSLVLRFNNMVKLRVMSGGTLISSSPEGRIFIIAGSAIESGTRTVIFDSKYDKKTLAKLISATFNGKPVKLN